MSVVRHPSSLSSLSSLSNLSTGSTGDIADSADREPHEPLKKLRDAGMESASTVNVQLVQGRTAETAIAVHRARCALAV